MPTLREYFVSESNTYFAQLTDQLNRFDSGRAEPNELVRLTRALRGSAHLAREERVYQAAVALESAARALSNGSLTWNSDVSARARESVADLRVLAGGENDEAGDTRVKQVQDRWRAAGVSLPDSQQTGAAQSSERSPATRQFREFAAHEVAGIVSELEASLAQFPQDPRNRDVLKAILRRQRALLGAARLDEVSVVAETLRAIEDLVRLIVKLNVAVKEEWAAVFRAARDVLTGALEPLRQGLDPNVTPALSKLRTLRTELLDRFGEDSTLPAAGATLGAPSPARSMPPAAPAPAPSMSPLPTPMPAPVAAPAAAAAQQLKQTVAPTPAQNEDVIVPIEQLCYSGEPALRRALELREQLEKLAGDDSDAHAAVEEVFDLIRLGIG
jgi:chemotaxis protein histidine kinase CheA